MDNSQVMEGKVDWRGKPAKKDVHGGVVPALLIIMVYAINSIAYVGLATNLVTYFTGVMNFGVAKASNMVTNFMGTTFILALLGAYFADAHVGRCRIVLISLGIELLGLVLLMVQAHFPSLKPPPCNIYNVKSECQKVAGANAALLFMSIYALGVGLAGLFAALPAHGADQFDDTDLRECRRVSSFFNWLTASNAIGSIHSLTLVVWVQTHVGWDRGFGMSAVCIFVAIVVFAAGIPRYQIHPVGETNPIVEILQVLVAAIRNSKLALPRNASELYEIEPDAEASKEIEFIPHRDTFRFLDKAAIRRTNPTVASMKTENETPSPWRQCRVTQVENTKNIVGMLPIFICSIFMSTCLAQLQTFTVQQGFTMDNHVSKHVTIAPANLGLAPTVFMVVAIPIYDRFAVPFMRKFTGHPAGITNLQRIGVGLLLSSLSMMVAAGVEMKRKKAAESHGMLDANPLKEKLPLSIFWLVFQHFIFGISDMFSYVGLSDFFYSEAPKTMKSIATAFLWCSIGLGYFISSIVVDLVNHATKHNTESGGWLAGNNLNRVHLDLFYWTLAVLTLLNFLNYLYWAKRYEYKRQPYITSQVNVSIS